MPYFYGNRVDSERKIEGLYPSQKDFQDVYLNQQTSPEARAYLTLSNTTISAKNLVAPKTTLIALEYDEGVVIAADSRTSSGTFVVNRVTDKLTPLTDSIFCCRSGSAADTQATADIVRYQLDFYRMQLNCEPTVRAAAETFRSLSYRYRDDLMAGIIVAGWDVKNGGQVYSIPIGGMLKRQALTCGGSGSTFIYGFLDANFKENMTKDECLDLALKAVTLAITRDNSSGGCVRLASVSKAGVERRVVLHPDLPKFYEG